MNTNQLSLLTLKNNTLTMSSLEIAELTGKQHKHVTADIRKLLKELDLDAADFSAPQKYGNNNTRTVFTLDKLLTTDLITGYSAKLRHAINKRWMELEGEQPSFEDNPTLFLERMLVISRERDEAIRTKAEIGSKREATAMSTASVQTRRANKLESEKEVLEERLGFNGNYRQVKGISWISDIFKSKKGKNTSNKKLYMSLGQRLSKLSKKMCIDIVPIDDPTYGKVNTYHLDVIECFKVQLEADENLMKQFR